MSSREEVSELTSLENIFRPFERWWVWKHIGKPLRPEQSIQSFNTLIDIMSGKFLLNPRSIEYEFGDWKALEIKHEPLIPRIQNLVVWISITGNLTTFAKGNYGAIQAVGQIETHVPPSIRGNLVFDIKYENERNVIRFYPQGETASSPPIPKNLMVTIIF